MKEIHSRLLKTELRITKLDKSIRSVKTYQETQKIKTEGKKYRKEQDMKNTFFKSFSIHVSGVLREEIIG